MKKIVIALSAFAALFAVSCNKETPSVEQKQYTVNFSVAANDTKTVFGTQDGNSLPVLWVGGEDIDVALNENPNSAIQNTIQTVVADSPSASASWSADFTDVITKCELTAPYKFYAFYPGKKLRAFYNGDEHRIKAENIPSVQTPSAASPDPDAMFVYSISDEYTEFPENVTMPGFKHMTAYGCLTLGSGIPDDAIVSSVKITANDEQYLSGPAWYYYDSDTWANHSSSADNNSITINTSSKSDIWFGCRATDNLTTLTFTVQTDKGTYKKTANAPGQLAAGKVRKMTVGGFVKDATTYVWSAKADGMINVGTGTTTRYTALDSPDGLTWSGNVATQTVTSSAPSLDWTFVTTAVTGNYFVQDGLANNRFKIGTGTDLLSPFVVRTSVPAGKKIQKVSIYSGSATSTKLNLTVTVGGEYVIGSEESPVQLAATTNSNKSTGYETVSDDNLNKTGEVVIAFNCSSPFYIYKFQIDCD